MEIENSKSNTFVKAVVLAGVSLILGLCFDYFFYGKVPGIGFPIYIVLVVIGLLAVAAYFNRRIDKQVMWLLVPLGFFSFMVFIRSSVLLTFLNIIASLLLLLLVARISFAEKLKNFLVADYIKIFFLPFEFIRPLLQTLSALFMLPGADKDRKVLWQVIKGIIVAIPILVVFLMLFSSADLVFQKYLSDLIRINIKPETVFRLILVLIAALAFTGAYSYIFSKSPEALPETNNKLYPVGHIEASILLGSINVLFLIFIFLQLTYLFGGESNISSQGFTYAAYARKGFFELIAVAVISFLILWSTEKYIVRKNAEHSLLFKILSSALIAQAALIMGSAFKRLSLYEEAYGFTTLRFYSHAFIILLAVIFCLLLYKIYKDRRENAFAFRIFISVTLFLTVMNLLNPEAFIARQNVERFETTGKLDIYYLSGLSDDAISANIKILSIANEDLRRSFGRELYRRAKRADSALFSRWQSLNISRIKAEKILKLRMGELSSYEN